MSDSVRRIPHVVFPLGAGALTVEFGDRISAGISAAVLSLDEAVNRRPFPGFIESVPAYASLSVFYDPLAVRRAFPEEATAFAAVVRLVESLLDEGAARETRPPDAVTVPVDFGPDSAPDLGAVARRAGLSETEVIGIFLSREYRVFMIGFLPGFAYMGEVDERIATPRRETPRLSVPAGSVGIAGTQTGIYPLESPGGWQIIGRTRLTLFDPDADEPYLFRPGDRVRFVRDRS